MTHLSEEQLTLLYFEEASAAERSHLNLCAGCRQEYRRLADLLDAMRAVPVPEQAEDWERRIWRTIEPQAREQLARRKWMSIWYWAPAMAVLLVCAFVAGLVVQNRFIATRASFSPNARERVFLLSMSDHLGRSELVLAELANAPSGSAANITAEQQLAQNLIGENRMLRLAAVRAGNPEKAAVLEDLERILLEIANEPAEPTRGELEQIRQQIEHQGLLFKLRVAGANAREKGMRL